MELYFLGVDIANLMAVWRLILWNPSIKKTLYLPPPRSCASTVTTLLGLGYDPRSDDYKVPRIVRLGNSVEHPFVFQFFSLNSGSWSENVDFFINSLENKDVLWSITISCYDNRAMDLLSFNVFEHVSYSRGFNCEIWVMEQYGVRESWTRLYWIEMLHIARPMVLRSNGEILMAGYRSDRLVSCQPLTQRIRDTGLELSANGYAAYFVQSLALLDK
ncbi:hypothetical protein OIU79_005452 [Salix purpurea]|uniref:F-box associated domain-containing protein n=1 Tax=Salix purpurea TaxID=77065 RepID=A0A9Q0UCJ8_SALPP|nr:hypothetical protein OIU79_005452 [Salix purpurea]